MSILRHIYFGVSTHVNDPGAPQAALASFERLVLLPEPVSPELVLVDPDLARRERARLVERAELAAIVNGAMPRGVVEWEPLPTAAASARGPDSGSLAEFFPRRLVPAALILSLIANGLLAARLVVGAGQEASSESAPPTATFDQDSSASLATPATSVGSAVTTAQASSPAVTSEPSALPISAKASVERRLMSLIISAPARKLPRGFVDATTGLVKNNVQVLCRRRAPRSFLCIVRLPNSPPTAGIYVAYRGERGGREVFTWYGYKARLQARTFLDSSHARKRRG
jgi:hypothetical protein